MHAARFNPRGLYVHIPFCDGKCAYCAFYSTPYQPALADRYLAALAREFARYPALTPETIYIGGGTPSMLAAPQLHALCQMILTHTARPHLVEWTVEVNPGSLTGEKLSALVQAGVNRISLGAQSFNDAVLRRLERRHTVADIFKSVTLIRAAGIRNLGLDLMACVPGGGGRIWSDTLRQALACAPEHISVYALTNEEGSRLGRRFRQGDWKPLSDGAQLKALDAAEAALARAGYARYEISNYAKPGFECRHNLACWRGAEYIGLGPAAASHIGLQRWTNQADLAAYQSALEQNAAPPGERELLSPAQKIQEQVIFGLRMAEGVSVALALAYQDGLRQLAREGLIKKAHDRWRLTPRGRHLADYVAVELLQAN